MGKSEESFKESVKLYYQKYSLSQDQFKELVHKKKDQGHIYGLF